MAKLWKDTRPDRPAGDYLAGGVVFTGGFAETKSVSPGTAALFAALGIVEVKPPAGTVDEPTETPDPEGAEPVEIVGEPLTEAEQADLDASGVEPPVLEQPKRSRGAK